MEKKVLAGLALVTIGWAAISPPVAACFAVFSVIAGYADWKAEKESLRYVENKNA